MRLILRVEPGEYSFSLGLSEPLQGDQNVDVGFNHDRLEQLGPLKVGYHSRDLKPFYGVAELPLEISSYTV